MSNFDELLRNNADFARTGAKDRVPEVPFIPNKQVYILTCIDPRVDPAQVFGLELGDAIVARTVGGRVTPAGIQDLAWISYLHEKKTPPAASTTRSSPGWPSSTRRSPSPRMSRRSSTHRRSHPRSPSRGTPTMSR